MALPLRFTSGQGPQRAEWEHHKQTITHLYMEMDMTLKEMASIMLEKHGFKATTKMYKTRFQQWGLRKNLSNNENKILRVQVATGRRVDLPVVYGRKMGSQRFQSQAHRHNTQLSRPVSTAGTRAITLQVPMAIKAPDTLKLAEHSIWAAVDYSKSRLDIWHLPLLQKWQKTESNDWSYDMKLAIHMIKQNPNSKKTFQLLNQHCDRFKTIVQRQDPWLLYETLFIILEFLKVDSQLAALFLKLAKGFCSVYFGVNYPLTMLWDNMEQLSTTELRALAGPLADMQYRLFRTETRPGSKLFSSYALRMARDLHNFGLSPRERSISRLDDAMNWARQCPNKTRDTANILANIAVYKSCVHGDYLDFREAMKCLNEAEEVIEIDSIGKDNNQLANLLEVKANLLEDMGNYEEAERYFKMGLATVMNHTDNGTRLIWSIKALRDFYLRTGNIEAAQKVGLDLDAHAQFLVGH